MVTSVVGESVESGMNISYSEYPLRTWPPLQPNFDLHSENDALWVEGIGHIAQYHCYFDLLYSHGFIYFLRDTLEGEIKAKVDAGTPLHEVREPLDRLATLNSKICAYEQQQHNANH